MANQKLTESRAVPRTAAQHRRRLHLVGAVFIVGAAVLASPPRALATTRYVDPAAASAAPGTGCGAAAAYSQICAAPGPGTGTPCAAGSALAAAIPGDTIEVCAGTYNENVEISISNVTLHGAKAGVPAGPDAVPAGRGVGESIIVGQTTSAIHLSVSGLTGVVIDGFTIQSGNFPAIHDNPNFASTSHVWANNIIEAGAGCGAALGAINLNRFSDTQILNNHIVGCGWGIQNQTGVPTSLPSLIEGNYFGGAGNSIILGTGHAPGNIIRDNLFERSGSGIIAGCPGLVITDNTFQVGGSAIYFHTNATGATITGNEILNGSNGIRQRLDFGPYTLGPTNEVHYNNIVGNTGFGAENQVPPGDQDIDATCNWWGSADGPSPTGSGDAVTAGVEYVPWLVAPAPGGACIGGLATATPTPTPTPTVTATPTPVCGNGVVEPLGGETCDPPGSMQPPNGNSCRADCTFCGDGIVQAPESCDDGNSDQCDPVHPQKPVQGDTCNNQCAGLICKDPSSIKLTSGSDVFKAHGVLIPMNGGRAIDFDTNELFIGLSTEAGVIFETSLPAGRIEKKPNGSFRYRDVTARTAGGIYQLKAKRTRDGTYKLTVIAYGEIVGAGPDMVTHIRVGDQEWTVQATWKQRGSGWKFVSAIP